MHPVAVQRGDDGFLVLRLQLELGVIPGEGISKRPCGGLDDLRIGATLDLHRAGVVALSFHHEKAVDPDLASAIRVSVGDCPHALDVGLRADRRFCQSAGNGRAQPAAEHAAGYLHGAPANRLAGVLDNGLAEIGALGGLGRRSAGDLDGALGRRC